MQARNSGRTRELKLAILSSFSISGAELRDQLRSFKVAEWDKALWWLDASGLALYFLDRAWNLGPEAILPESIEAQLHQRLQRNRQRTQAMLQESALLAGWFHGAGIPYALLKGITLVPDAVSNPDLRSQADLDFLVAEKSAALATHYINRLGYRLHARSGSTLEFRAGTTAMPDMSMMYSHRTERSVELHLACSEHAASTRLTRRTLRTVHGNLIFSLCPQDMLVQQALHLLKHLSGEFTRISWVLEFCRHVQTHRSSPKFWTEVERTAAAEPNGDLAMAIAFWLVEELFGPSGIEVPPQWQSQRIPERVQLWLKLYALDVLLADTIGNKLYALLKKEIPGTSRDSRTLLQVLVPRRLPIRKVPSTPTESRPFFERYAIEVNYALRRLYFHVIEGVRFAFLSARWMRAVSRSGR